MNTQRRKYLRKLAIQARKRETRHISEIDTLLYKSIFIKYLPKADDFIMSIDMMINGTEIRTMGVITPEALVEDGIQIITPENAINNSMTCRELFLTRTDVPNLFTIVKTFYNTIGDIFDAGEEITSYNAPSLTIYNDDKYFSDVDVTNLSVIRTTKKDVLKLLDYYMNNPINTEDNKDERNNQ